MKHKLYIINNGMKDLRGHYFETAASIVEASRELGLRPILAGHVDCPREIVPDVVEFYPVFTTDHWMGDPPPLQSDLRGIRGELGPLAVHRIEDLIDGKIDFASYLDARFTPDEVEASVPPPEPAPLPPPPSGPSQRARVKQLARRWLPPAVVGTLKAARTTVRLLLPPVLCNLLRDIIRGDAVVKTPAEPAIEAPDPTVADETPPPRPDPVAEKFIKSDNYKEYIYYEIFKQDLERFLSLTGCSSDDHVFMPTAHGRELCAVQHLLASWPVEARPTFHLEFRHALDLDGAGVLTESDPYCRDHRVFFEIARSFPPSERLRLYTDSDGLSEEYERSSGLEFDVLPIPFRSRLLARPPREEGPLCVAYFGDVRDEKGFDWLPDLVDFLREEFVRPGRVRFLIQASLVHPEHEPKSRAALARLREYPAVEVQLVGLEGPLDPDAYYQLVAHADLLICPYRRATYRNRSSGTLTEALAAGIPTIVPGDTWLARQQPPGSGETFVDQATFLRAVRRVCQRYDAYRWRARAGRDAWSSRHSPERLVRRLLTGRNLRDPTSATANVA